MKKVCVVIPIYQDKLNVQEQISLEQCFRILGQYPIYFAIPEKLQANIAQTGFLRGANAEFKVFSDHFFSGLPGYNKLMKYPGFYKAFLDYEFMLVYQLDAFVFKDELTYWCDQDFDYIGAPFMSKTVDGPNEFEIIGQGNGGFSLRKVARFYQVVRKCKKLNFAHPFFDSKQPFYINLWRDFKYNVLYNFSFYPFQPVVNEDVFWSELVPKAFSFRVPETRVAIPFSFEVAPSYLYRLNSYRLPFGCHGWLKYEPDFWKGIMKEVRDEGQ